MRGPLPSVGGSVGTGVSGPRRWGRGPGFAVGRWSRWDHRRLAPATWFPARSRAGIQAFSRESPDAKSRGGWPPAPPFFRPRSLALAGFGGCAALFRSMGYYGAYVCTLIWRLSFIKCFFSIFFRKNASQIGFSIPEETSPLPYQRQRSPKRASGSKRAIKLGVQGACPRPSFSPFLGRNGDPRRAGGAPRALRPKGSFGAAHPEGTYWAYSSTTQTQRRRRRGTLPTSETRMAQRKLAHAYLVVGENRRQLADQLAAAWVCTGEAPPCGHCAGCRKAAAGDPPRHCPGGSGGGGAEGRGRPCPSVGRLHPAQRGAKEGLPPGARGTAEPDGAEHPAQTHRGGPLLMPASSFSAPTRSSFCPPSAPGARPSGPRGEETHQASQEGEQLANLHSRRRSAGGVLALPHFPGKAGPGGDRLDVGGYHRPAAPPPCPSGRTFYRCWTGLPPFSGPATSTSVRAIRAAGLPPLCR